MSDLYIEDGHVRFRTFDGSPTTFVVAYVCYYIILRLCALFESGRHQKLIIELVAVLQLVMLNELILLSSIDLMSYLLIIVIALDLTFTLSGYLNG